MSKTDRALDDIRRRSQARKDSGLIGGVREWFDIDYLLRVIDTLQAQAKRDEK